MNLKFFKQHNHLYKLVNIRYYYIFMGLGGLFFFIRMAFFYEFNATNRNDKFSLLAGSLFFALLFLGFCFDTVIIDTERKTITSKKFFTLLKKTITYYNVPVDFITTRHTMYGIFSGIDVAIEADYKRIVIKRLFNTNKIELLINEIKNIMGK